MRSGRHSRRHSLTYDPRPATGLVVDTTVISWLFDGHPNELANRYRELIDPQPVLLTIQTVMDSATAFSEPAGKSYVAADSNGGSWS